MLRLNLKDLDDTVLFINPMNGVEIGKLYCDYSENIYRLTIGKPGTGMYETQYAYSSKEDRDIAYEYVLAKINEYLFPQIEFGEVCCDE